MNTLLQKDTLRALTFRPITAADYGRIAHYMELTDSQTCDYTLGGVVLWADFFNYQIAEADDTLFIRGGREDDLRIPAYSLPLGGGDFTDAIDHLRATSGSPIWFSAIPEDRLHLFTAAGCAVSPLGPEWSDYLYNIDSFVTLAGNAMKKKRNHVNRFKADNPEAHLEDMTAENARLCLQLLARLGNDGSPTGRAEQLAVARMLIHWRDFAPYFRGAVLKMADGEIAGFTVGEIKHDTLHVHVEKANHAIAGSGETLAHLFAAKMKELYPRLAYANRQDDAGSDALRAAKESWRPLRLLPKFNVYVK
ncbi:MAG: phosphatidylglycerol lysyltransferase domain-containing protein [Muribaculaceae bacterium]|nr:phosphatidylglycerol lysyltransferase domain-containing protein [Muribaculaceae bacterium]